MKEQLVEAVIDGTLDIIGSDHCTYDLDIRAQGKANFSSIPQGINGIEERMAIVYERGVLEGKMEMTLSVNSETLEKVSVSTTFAQSRWASVSTTSIFLSLDESRSRQLKKIRVSMGLGLDNFEKSESR